MASESILVGVRVRKLLDREFKKGSGSQWEWDGGRHLIWAKSTGPGQQVQKSYSYDRVFTPSDGNDCVYEQLAAPVIASVIQGFNATIFAYGQTASGKTHTMMSEDDPGVIRRAVSQIFEELSNSAQNIEYLIRVSYMEIYNEELTDLLTKPEKRKPLKLMDDGGQTKVDGLLEVPVSSEGEVYDLMQYGERYRHFGETNMNDRSSRSHTIFRICIEWSEVEEDASVVEGEGRTITVSQLNLVDLAGSERAAQTGAVGDRFREGVNINSSLLVLGQVIAKLSEQAEAGPGRKEQVHIPFRDSKLTRILKNSLGGNARTIIICTVSPAEKEQSRSTLEFASRAKTIKTHATKNEIVDDRAQMIRDKKEIKQLQDLLMEKDAQLNAIMNQDQKKEDERTNLLDKLDKLQNFILHSRPNLNEEPVVKVKELPKRRMSWHPSLFQKRRSSLGFALKPIVLDDDDFRKRLEEMEARQPISHQVTDTSSKSPFSKSAEDIQQELHAEEFESSVFASPTVQAMNLESLPQRITERRKGKSNDRKVRFMAFESPLPMIGEDDGSMAASVAHPVHTAETPKTVLRERLFRKDEHIQRLSEEYKELQEFTRLESQLNHGPNKAISGLATSIQHDVDDALRHVHLMRRDCELLENELQKERAELAELKKCHIADQMEIDKLKAQVAETSHRQALEKQFDQEMNEKLHLEQQKERELADLKKCQNAYQEEVMELKAQVAEVSHKLDIEKQFNQEMKEKLHLEPEELDSSVLLQKEKELADLKKCQIAYQEEIMELKAQVAEVSHKLDLEKQFNQEMNEKLHLPEEDKPDSTVLLQKERELVELKECQVAYQEEIVELKAQVDKESHNLDLEKQFNQELKEKLHAQEKDRLNLTVLLQKEKDELAELKKCQAVDQMEIGKLKAQVEESSLKLDLEKQINQEINEKLHHLEQDQLDSTVLLQKERELSELKECQVVYQEEIVELKAQVEKESHNLELEKQFNEELKEKLHVQEQDTLDLTVLLQKERDELTELKKFQTFDQIEIGKLKAQAEEFSLKLDLEKQYNQELHLLKQDKLDSTVLLQKERDELAKLQECQIAYQREITELTAQVEKESHNLELEKQFNEELKEKLHIQEQEQLNLSALLQKEREELVERQIEISKLEAQVEKHSHNLDLEKQFNLELRENLRLQELDKKVETKSVAVGTSADPMPDSDQDKLKHIAEGELLQKERDELAELKECQIADQMEIGKLKAQVAEVSHELDLERQFNQDLNERLHLLKQDKLDSTVLLHKEQELAELKECLGAVHIQIGELEAQVAEVSHKLDIEKKFNQDLNEELEIVKQEKLDTTAFEQKERELAELMEHQLADQLEIGKLKAQVAEASHKLELEKQFNHEMNEKLHLLKQDKLDSMSSAEKERELAELKESQIADHLEIGKLKAQVAEVSCRLDLEKHINQEMNEKLHLLRQDNLDSTAFAQKERELAELKERQIADQMEIGKLKAQVDKAACNLHLEKQYNRELKEKLRRQEQDKLDSTVLYLRGGSSGGPSTKVETKSVAVGTSEEPTGGITQDKLKHFAESYSSGCSGGAMKDLVAETYKECIQRQEAKLSSYREELRKYHKENSRLKKELAALTGGAPEESHRLGGQQQRLPLEERADGNQGHAAAVEAEPSKENRDPEASRAKHPRGAPAHIRAVDEDSFKDFKLEYPMQAYHNLFRANKY